MNQYFVYILHCSDKSYYTGITNDLERRIYEHETGINLQCYTFKRRPHKLVFQERFPEVNQAIAFEKQVKGWSRAKKEAIINGRWDELPALSKKKKSITQLTSRIRPLAPSFDGAQDDPRHFSL
jgi:putative endonuclease